VGGECRTLNIGQGRYFAKEVLARLRLKRKIGKILKPFFKIKIFLLFLVGENFGMFGRQIRVDFFTEKKLFKEFSANSPFAKFI